MLRQRVTTALILAGALIATLLYVPYEVQAILFGWLPVLVPGSGLHWSA